ncbi:stamen-specific protein FIL1-like [Bidens hawaiensis]|uniref:stamen-specific protein FIL1-like n=1 Tax=Bidens hawaiensis TaxID=980011 RepID=UPI00404B87D8
MGVFQIRQVTLVLLIVALVARTHGQTVQTCPGQLGTLNVCAPFVVPGSPTNVVPSSDCCVALQSVDRDCLCNTIRIASSLPSQCNFPVSCGNALEIEVDMNGRRI